MTTSIHASIEAGLARALAALGLADVPARLVPCPDPTLGDAAVQAALAGARVLRRPPMAIAADIAERLRAHPDVAAADAAAPGYVNLRFRDAAIARALAAQAADPAFGIVPVAAPERIVIDFGGPNVGKALHVGHFRSFVIGESLRRLLAAAGHRVVSDIHLGDWGLPAGMIVDELALRGLAGPWLAPEPGAAYPVAAPIAEADLATLYPSAAAACRDDTVRMARARAVAARMQAGDPGASALWRSVVELAGGPIRAACERLDAHFDLFLGESDVQDDVPGMLAALEGAGIARRDGNALLVDLARVGDRKPMPPLVLAKEDGSALYATADLATAARRARDLRADRILYVVDARQALHFEQVARAAERGGLAPGVAFEHVGFGTVNGPDGKPFRTRDGGTMALADLLDLARDRALDAVRERVPADSAGTVAEAVGLAALRFADLGAHRDTGYVLDVERALSFEGRTGPYVLYALVRLRSLLARSGGGSGGPFRPGGPAERALAMAVLGFGAAVHRAVGARSPHELVTYGHALAGALSRFYVECPVASEPDAGVRASRIALATATERTLARVLDLLACRVPAAM